MRGLVFLVLGVGLVACEPEDVPPSIDDLLSADYLTDAERDVLLERGVRDRMERLGEDRLSASFPLIDMPEEEFEELEKNIVRVVESSEDNVDAVEEGFANALRDGDTMEALREVFAGELEEVGVTLTDEALDSVFEAAMEMATGIAAGVYAAATKPSFSVTRNITVAEAPPPPPSPPPPPTPWKVNGSGDDIVAVPRGVSRLRIEAMSHGGGNFAVWCVGPFGERNELLVNEIVHDVPYSGLRRLRGCAELDLNASGVSWSLAEP